MRSHPKVLEVPNKKSSVKDPISKNLTKKHIKNMPIPGPKLLLFQIHPGSRYRCSALQNPREELKLPSVEGALLGALASCQVEVLGVQRAGRSDRGAARGSSGCF